MSSSPERRKRSIRIYRVQHDSGQFQSLVPEDPTQAGRLVFDGTPREGWELLRVRIAEPGRKRGNFFALGNALVFDESAYDPIGMHMEMSGEILPVELEGERLHLLNITGCFAVLDEQQTRWIERSDGRSRVERYVFFGNRMGTPLFTAPETCEVEAYAFERNMEAEEEFPAAYREAGLTGLVFTEIWSGNY